VIALVLRRGQYPKDWKKSQWDWMQLTFQSIMTSHSFLTSFANRGGHGNFVEVDSTQQETYFHWFFLIFKINHLNKFKKSGDTAWKWLDCMDWWLSAIQSHKRLMILKKKSWVLQFLFWRKWWCRLWWSLQSTLDCQSKH
jgi:hypothetical protein